MTTSQRRIASVLVLSLIAFNVMSVVAGANPEAEGVIDEVISSPETVGEQEEPNEGEEDPTTDIPVAAETNEAAPKSPESGPTVSTSETTTAPSVTDTTRRRRTLKSSATHHTSNTLRTSGQGPPLPAPGSNGTVKTVDVNNVDFPGTDPHLPCTFRLRFENFDPNQVVAWRILTQSPTNPNGSLLATGPGVGGTVTVDPVGNLLTPIIDLNNSFSGFTGSVLGEWHVELQVDIETPFDFSRAGGDNKFKVFWVDDCQPNGTIRIDKTVSGAGADAAQAFDLTGTIDGNAVQDMSANSAVQVFSNVPVGTYSVGETNIPANWDLTDISCKTTDGLTDDPNSTNSTSPGTLVPADTAQINVAAGETVTCAFNNHYTAPPNPTGTIRLDKTVTGIGADAAQVFDLTGTIDGNAVQDMSANTAVQVFSNVPVGTYSVGETNIPANWDLTDISCKTTDGLTDDPNSTNSTSPGTLVPADTAQIDLSANETVTCTLNNHFTAPAGTLIVDKVVTGGGDPSQLFQFTDNSPDLTMVDIADNTPLTTSTFTVPPGDYKIQETITGQLLTAGWTLTSVTCNDGNSTGTVNSQSHGQADFKIENAETVTCTFTNNFSQPTGTIQIEKIVTGVGAPAGEDFDFDGEIDTDLQDGDTSNKVVNAPGTYTVDEVLTPAQIAAGWSLTGIDCDDGASATPSTGVGNTATFKVDPGETVECEFTNDFLAPAAPQGTIQIVKALAAGSDTPPGGENFPFTGAIATTLQAGGSSAVVPVAPGTHAVTEGTLPADWTLDDITCTSSDAVDLTLNTVSTVTKQVTMNVSDNEDVVCTFHNLYTEPPGSLEIEKVLDPTSDPGTPNASFGFTGAIQATLQIGDTTGPQSLTAGPYSQTESTIPSGWTLTDITCTDPASVANLATGTVDVQIDPGEAEKCTFMNKWIAPPPPLPPPPPPPPPPPGKGVIIVDKVTDPAGDPTSFGFSLTGGAIDENFDLADAAVPFVSGDIDPGIYNVNETLPAGWNLTSATCDDGSLPGAIALAADETVTCTFVNTQRASIEAVLELIPSSGVTTRNVITLSPRALADFIFSEDLTGTLQNDGDSIGPTEVLPGTYSATQTTTAGWTLTDIDCTDPTSDSTGDVATGTATFRAAPGENVVCVFTNVQDEVKGGVITNPGDPGGDDETEEPEVLGRPSTTLPLTGSDPAGLVAIAALLIVSGVTVTLYMRRRVES